MTFKKQGEGFFIGTASSEVPDIERGDLEQALKKAPLFLAIIFSYFCVFLAEQWNHDVILLPKLAYPPTDELLRQTTGQKRTAWGLSCKQIIHMMSKKIT